jgi:hypothetical protein
VRLSWRLNAYLLMLEKGRIEYDLSV